MGGAKYAGAGVWCILHALTLSEPGVHGNPFLLRSWSQLLCDVNKRTTYNQLLLTVSTARHGTPTMPSMLGGPLPLMLGSPKKVPSLRLMAARTMWGGDRDERPGYRRVIRYTAPLLVNIG